MSKKIEKIYRKLSEVEHVLKRPGRYLGTISTTPSYTYGFDENKNVKWKEYSYSPAFLKLFDEIISNSADFSKREEGKHLNKIEVQIDKATGEISVFDNGGIPVVKHTEYNQYVPDMIFGELRSGSNFDDEEESTGTGQNGEGSTLTNIFSSKFTVDTADGKNRFLCTYYNNMSSKDTPNITKCKKSYTKISYIPDYEKLGMTMDDDHYDMLLRRTIEIAATNPHISVKFNNIDVSFKSFHDFAKIVSPEPVLFGNDRLQVALANSTDGFTQISFVNSTNVFRGGTHIDYATNIIISAIRDHIKKKTKQEVKPSDIKRHMFLVINATINNPRYSSQTKERLETPAKLFGCDLEIDSKTLAKIIKSKMVQQIIEWAERKQAAEEAAAVNKKNKDLDKSSLRHITKYEPATSKRRDTCILFVAEGDSAGKALQSARNPSIHGIYPLKGKPLNVRDMKVKQLIENEGLSNLMQILGLQFGKEHFVYELRYSKLVISTDQDLDGFHLCGLLINMFSELWPSLIKRGFLVKLQTPIVRVTQGKSELEFFSLEEFKEWEAKQTKSYRTTYLKGLGSNDTKYFKKYMFDEKYFVPITYKDVEDANALEIAFSKSKADERKKFIYGDVQ